MFDKHIPTFMHLLEKMFPLTSRCELRRRVKFSTYWFAMTSLWSFVIGISPVLSFLGATLVSLLLIIVYVKIYRRIERRFLGYDILHDSENYKLAKTVFFHRLFFFVTFLIFTGSFLQQTGLYDPNVVEEHGDLAQTFELILMLAFFYVATTIGLVSIGSRKSILERLTGRNDKHRRRLLGFMIVIIVTMAWMVGLHADSMILEGIASAFIFTLAIGATISLYSWVMGLLMRDGASIGNADQAIKKAQKRLSKHQDIEINYKDRFCITCKVVMFIRNTCTDQGCNCKMPILKVEILYSDYPTKFGQQPSVNSRIFLLTEIRLHACLGAFLSEAAGTMDNFTLKNLAVKRVAAR